MSSKTSEWTCPEYQVRMSPRAKHVGLRIDRSGKLEVVIPRGFRRQDIPEVLFRKRLWLQKTLARIEQQPEIAASIRPDELHLRASGETWSLRFLDKGPDKGRNNPVAQLIQSNTNELRLYTDPEDAELQRELLRKWLLGHGRRIMEPQIRALSAQLELPFNRLSLRTQRSRWGSCSSKGNINLNALLLFLPTEWMRSVLIHELCHLRHPNHSSEFWALVARYDPGYRSINTAMREAWQYIPAWLTDK